MTTEDFLITLFCRIHDVIKDIPKHVQANLYERMIVETVLSMLTTICHFKKVMHRVWGYFKARLAFTMAVFNLLVGWDGFHPNPDGFVHLSIASFSL
jgi:hypothetical protein